MNSISCCYHRFYNNASFLLNEIAILDKTLWQESEKQDQMKKWQVFGIEEAEECIHQSSYSGNSAEIKTTIIPSQAIHFPTVLILQIAKRSVSGISLEQLSLILAVICP
jgi:hypothetical protein